MADDILSGIGFGLRDALLNLWNKFVEVIPGLLAALVVAIIGWIVARVLKEVVVKILQSTKVDQWIAEKKLSGAIGNREFSIIIGHLVKWYVLVVFLAQAVGLIQLEVLKNFVWLIVVYTPYILGGILIVVLGLLLAKYIANYVGATQHKYSKTVAKLAQVFVAYIAVVMALQTVGFDVTILMDAFRIAFIALAVTIAIIVGLSFGLAFKDEAKDIVADVKKAVQQK